jgi:hypothetical protein
MEKRIPDYETPYESKKDIRNQSEIFSEEIDLTPSQKEQALFGILWDWAQTSSKVNIRNSCRKLKKPYRDDVSR